MDGKTITFDEIIQESDYAIFVRIDNMQLWVPKSLINNWPDAVEDNELNLPMWFILQEGLEDYTD